MSLLEEEMVRRREQELALTRRVEEELNATWSQVLALSSARENAAELAKAQLGELGSCRQLIQEERAHREEDDRETLDALSSECDAVEREASALASDGGDFSSASEDMLKEVLLKVSEQLELESIDRRRMEDQIAVLVSELYDKLQPGTC